MEKKVPSPPLPAHRVRINVPEDDFVETPSSIVPNQVQPSTKAKKKKKTVGKKSAPDPPSDSPMASKDLTQTLISAGLTEKKHELSDSHRNEIRKARKAKYDKIIQELDEEEAQRINKQQGTLLEFWDKEDLDTAYPSVARPEVMTQFTQLSQGPVVDDNNNKENEPPVDVCRDESNCSDLPQYKYLSSVTKTVVEKKKIQIFDLTNSSDEYGPRKPSDAPVKKEQVNTSRCSHCAANECHNILFGNYCFSRVQKYFSEDKLLANRHNAEKLYVKTYNSALDYHTYTTTKTLTDYPVLLPPLCIQKDSMKISLEWFDKEKDKYTMYIRYSRVAKRRVSARKNYEKEWEEYEERIGKRKYGGIQS